MKRAHIPYGGYWCTPFARWQGSLSHLHSVEFAAHVARKALADRNIDPGVFDHGLLGMTVPQKGCFYGLPWVAGLIGAGQIAGPTINQACATSARVMADAAREVAAGSASCVLALTTDRVSNGPHIYYPNPAGPGGTGDTEDWVMSNFNRDPFAGCDMTSTAENCARKWNITTAEQHEVVLRRYQQYQDALADDRAFQKRYMVLPLEVPDQRYKKTVSVLEGDEGIHPTTAEGLAKLRPVKEGGTVTYGGQTHPADGSAGMVITTEERARELSKDPAIRISLWGFGEARVEPAWMPAAPVPAAKRALEAAGIGVKDLAAIKSHNPFAVNDLVFARETGADLMQMNNYGCSLIWGHPQGPTGMRSVIELIEELVIRGGGWGLFHGCAAGDSSMAVVVKVG
jgi:acetyl-CoA acetyltransferase family protein